MSQRHVATTTESCDVHTQGILSRDVWQRHVAAVQRVHATESAFQPITNNDQNSSRSCIRKKSTWWPWIVEFALIGIDEKAYYYINDVDG